MNDHPISGHPGSGHPGSGHPISGHPTSGHPISGHPTSGHPTSGHPTSGHDASATVHEEAAVGWVLHTLDRDDEVTFLVHLEGCASCRRTVSDISTALSSVGAAVAQEEPPQRLHDSLMAAVVEESRPPRRLVVDDAEADVSGGIPAPLGARDPKDLQTDDRAGSEGVSSSLAGHPARPDRSPDRPEGDGATVIPMRRGSRARRFALVAAVAVLVAVIGGLVAVNRSLTEQRDLQAAEADRVTVMLRDAGRAGAVHATLADPNGAMVGMVVDIGSGPRVLSTGLGNNPPDETYVLWSLAGTRPRPIGTFDVSGSAPSVRSVGSVNETGRPQGYAVSLEPGRTAPASPTTIVASGQVGR